MSKLIDLLKKLQPQRTKKQKLGEGNFSVAFLKEKNGQPFVIKKPRKGMDKEQWNEEIESAQEGLELIENLDLPVFIPKILKRKYDYVLEEYAPGKTLTAALYNSLFEEEQNKIAHDIAVSLNKIHQKILLLKDDKAPQNNYFDSRFERYLDKIVDADMFALFQNISKIFKLNYIGRTQAITHQDLRSENILYDKTRQQTSIIDLGLMDINSDVYSDFSPLIYKPIGLPWTLTKKIVENYNQQEKETPIFIDINLVRDLQLINIFNTFSAIDDFSEIYNGTNEVSKNALKAASKTFEKDFKPQIMERLADRPSDGHTTPEMRYRPYLFKDRLAGPKNSR